MSSKRILFVAEAFGGGTFEVVRMHAEGLSRRGFAVGIAYGRRPETPDDVRAAVDPSVELISLPWNDRSLRAQVRAHRALRRLLKVWQPDLVHLASSFAGLHGALARIKVPTIYTPHGYAFTMKTETTRRRAAYLVLETLVASQVDVIGACSFSEGEHARSLPTSDMVVVVPNGIDELNAAPRLLGLAGKEPSVVAMGRPLPQRQPEACARILGAVSGQARVEWIGGGSDQSPGTRVLQAAGIAMSGWLPREQTLSRLSASMIYLHWTAWDGLPLSVLEAMARDVIVVASDIGASREILGPRQVCRTESEAIHLIRTLLADATARDECLDSQRHRRLAYSADEMVTNWVRVYQQLSPDW